MEFRKHLIGGRYFAPAITCKTTLRARANQAAEVGERGDRHGLPGEPATTRVPGRWFLKKPTRAGRSSCPDSVAGATSRTRPWVSQNAPPRPFKLRFFVCGVRPTRDDPEARIGTARVVDPFPERAHHVRCWCRRQRTCYPESRRGLQRSVGPRESRREHGLARLDALIVLAR